VGFRNKCAWLLYGPGALVFFQPDPAQDWALIATMIVLRDINSAPTAGVSRIPIGARMPAAKGKATTLYPVAHKRFWTIFL
jgi:hypothetical protein